MNTGTNGTREVEMDKDSWKWPLLAALAVCGCFGGSGDDESGGGAGSAGIDGQAGDGAGGTGGSGTAGDGIGVGNAGRGGAGGSAGGAGGTSGQGNAAVCDGIDRTGSWAAISDAGAPPDLADSSWLDVGAWWTGDRATFLYGRYGMDGLISQEGAQFDPARNEWSAVEPSGAPDLWRRLHWTGSEVIAWSPADETGGFYDPAANAWSPGSFAGAPEVGGLWNGANMLVTENGAVSSADDFRMAKVYDFHAGEWTRITGDGATPRSSYGSAWVGRTLVVWGGWANGLGEALGDGAVFDLDTMQASATSAKGAPSPRYEPIVVAAGDRVIVWGGATIGPSEMTPTMLSDGAVYDPAKDAWTPMSTKNAPAGRARAVAVWTGTRLVVTGGHIFDPKMGGGYGPDMADGGIYDPDADTWTSLAKSPDALPGQPQGGPWSRIFVTANHEVVFLDEPLTAIQILDAEANDWSTIPVDEALQERISYWAFWTGCELVVWGGKRETASYDCADAPPDQPVCDAWTEYENLPDGRMFVAK